MGSTFKSFTAALLTAALIVSFFAGCQTITPELNHTHSSTEHTPSSTGPNATTGTTESTKPTESTPGTETTVPGTQPTDPTQPSIPPADPTQPSTQPSDPTQPGTRPTDPTQPSTQPTNPTNPTQPAGCAHNWDEWTVIKLPTCGIDGEKVRGCPKCSATEFAAVPAFGHTWGESRIETVSTSCGETTAQVRICKTCQHEEKKVIQITGSHTFGAWEYEEYTYQVTSPNTGKVKTYTSHRKVRFCTKCNYKESENTEKHVCQIGSAVHNVTVEREGDCQTIRVFRSTCTFCGWSTTFDRGEYGNHNSTAETKHLTDYGDYTNELDVTIRTCSICKGIWYNYTVGKGYQRHPMKYYVSCASGTAYLGLGIWTYTNDRPIQHPTWQAVMRNEKFDSEGYLIQWDYIWHDEKGTRYSYTIRMEDIPAMFTAAGYDLRKYEGYASVNYHLIIDGDRVRPYKIGFS